MGFPPLVQALGAACGLLLLAVGVLASRNGRLKAALAAAEAKLKAPPPPPPPRRCESRREEFGLLWFPVLTVKDEDKAVLSVTAGLPHCGRCVEPLAAESGSGEWVCAGCGERRPASTADLQVVDTVNKHALAEFLKRHPGYRRA